MKIKILLVLIVVYPLFFLFQGGDLTDVGFHCTNYIYFKDLIVNSGNVFYMMILTNYIGHCWYLLFPKMGLIAFKFLYLIFLYGSLIVSYIILKFHFKDRQYILFGLFFGEVFVTRYTPFVFSYDIASWFFLSLSIMLILYCLKTKQFLLALLCGGSVAAASLCRFPSASAIVIGVLYFNTGNISSIKSKFLYFFTFIFGFILIYFLYAALLDLDLFSLIYSYVTISPHVGGSSFNIFYKYFTEFIVFSLGLIGLYVLFYLYQKVKSKSNNKIILLFGCFLIIILGSFNFLDPDISSNKVFGYNSNLKFLVPLFVFFPVLLAFRHKKEHRNLILSIILCGLAQVFGSDTGLFLKFCFGCMLLIPITTIYVFDFKHIQKNNIFKGTREGFVGSLFLILGLCVLTRFGYVYNVNSGLTVRSSCLDKINHPKMIGILTNYRNAKIIENSLDLNLLKQENLYVYGHQPLIYYLSEKKPAFYPFWMYNLNANSLIGKLEKLKSLPIIYNTKEKVFGKKGEVIIANFLRKNEYSLIKNNGYGSLWIPKNIE